MKFGEALCNRFDDPRAKESWEGVTRAVMGFVNLFIGVYEVD